jgi:hypothetical protein
MHTNISEPLFQDAHFNIFVYILKTGEKITLGCQSAASWKGITEVLQAHSGPSGSTFYSCPEKVQLGASALHSDIPVLFFGCAVTSVETWGLNCNPLCYPPSGSTVDKLPSICSEAITNESALAQYVKTITECSLLLAVLVGAGSGGKAATWL